MSAKIAIIGAGPGGCMLARLLHRQAIPCIIFEGETSIDFRSQGGTLDLRPKTGLAAIKEAGLYDQFLKLCRFDGEALLITDKNQTTWLRRDPSKDGKGNVIAEMPEIDRVVLRKMLYESLPEGIVRWGHKLVKVEDDLSLHFANGRVESGFELIVGADGAWSKVRNFVTDQKPFYAGIGGYNLTIPDAEKTAPEVYKFINRGSVFAYSDGRNMSIQQIGDGSINVSSYKVQDEDWIKSSNFDPNDPAAAKKRLKSDLHDWSPQLLDAIESAQGDITSRNLYMLPVGFRPEHKKGVTLLGDAAHLMTPFAGIGVNTAFYDAMLLSNAISSAFRTQDPRGLDAHIIDYEDTMYVHAKAGQELTIATMTDMMLTVGAPRTTIQSWVTRHAKSEFPAWMGPIITAVVHTGYFFYKLFWV